MSEYAPPGDPEGAAVPARQALTPEAVEAVLADFRSWLLNPPAPSEASPPETEPVDLHTLLGQFIALRHEVNLQTRATRAQQEQTAEALRQLGHALEAVSRPAPALARAPDAEEAVRPLLRALVDVYDALALAAREVQRVKDALAPALAQLAGSSPSHAADGTPAVRLPFLARLFGGGEAVGRALAEATERRGDAARQAAERVRQLLNSVTTGYTMSLDRVERALGQHGLEPLTCLGEPFDPERMEAVEVVTQPGRSSTEVIEEVRRGYLWRGRVFRFAQVRVARPSS
jgi:molecular chaperone GrpE